MLVTLCVLASLWTAAQAVGLQALIYAIEEANNKGKVCPQTETSCLGEEVLITLDEDFSLDAPLPAIKNAANITIRGNCTRKGSRCIIDGEYKTRVFTFEGSPAGPPAKLQLIDLVFQKANGGVISSVWASVNAFRVVFRNNINTAIRMQGAFGGFPPQYYTNCRFMYNNGSAIIAGNSKLGLANQKLGFWVKRSVFYKNEGDNSSREYGGGGAVSLAGLGNSYFENTKFIANSAPYQGGAVYGDETYLIFRSVLFKNNRAGAVGGAVAGFTGFYHDSRTSFCSSTFEGNTSNGTAPALIFTTVNPGYKSNVNFCNTPIPEGSVFVAPDAGTVSEATGDQCFTQFC